MNDNILLVSEDYIKTTTSLSDNLEGKSLLPSIKLAQDIELEQVTGTALYRKLQELVNTNDIIKEENKDYKLLLDRYIQPFLAYQVKTYMVFELGTKETNMGVIETYDEMISTVRMSERNAVRSQNQHYADHYREKLRKYLKANHSLFPELNECDSECDENKGADLDTSFSTGLWLGGPVGKRLR